MYIFAGPRIEGIPHKAHGRHENSEQVMLTANDCESQWLLKEAATILWPGRAGPIKKIDNGSPRVDDFRQMLVLRLSTLLEAVQPSIFYSEFSFVPSSFLGSKRCHLVSGDNRVSICLIQNIFDLFFFGLLLTSRPADFNSVRTGFLHEWLVPLMAEGKLRRFQSDYHRGICMQAHES